MFTESCLVGMKMCNHTASPQIRPDTKYQQKDTEPLISHLLIKGIFILLNRDKIVDLIDNLLLFSCPDFLPAGFSFVPVDLLYKYACKQLCYMAVLIIRYKNTSAAIADEPMSADTIMAPFMPPVIIRTDQHFCLKQIGDAAHNNCDVILLTRAYNSELHNLTNYICCLSGNYAN